jgi:hypothetical protein
MRKGKCCNFLINYNLIPLYIYIYIILLVISENNINYILEPNLITQTFELRWFFDMILEGNVNLYKLKV